MQVALSSSVLQPAFLPAESLPHQMLAADTEAIPRAVVNDRCYETGDTFDSLEIATAEPGVMQSP